MAKVQSPLFSLEARGAIGKALVYFPWKGVNAVRKWLIPVNPRDVDQKIIRQKLAIVGKNLVVIETPKSGLLNGSKMYTMLKDKTPAGQIWNAYFSKTVMDYIKNDADFTALSAAYAGGTYVGAWTAAAAALGMAEITGANFATSIADGLQLFVAAKAAMDLALCDATNDYSTYPTNWATAIVNQFADDFTTA